MIQCNLCGEEITTNESDAMYNNQLVHLDCLHDIVCPHEENERL